MTTVAKSQTEEASLKAKPGCLEPERDTGKNQSLEVVSQGQQLPHHILDSPGVQIGTSEQIVWNQILVKSICVSCTELKMTTLVPGIGNSRGTMWHMTSTVLCTLLELAGRKRQNSIRPDCFVSYCTIIFGFLTATQELNPALGSESGKRKDKKYSHFHIIFFLGSMHCLRGLGDA